MAKALWAPVKWAQRKDSIYVTVDLPDVKDEKVKLSNTNLTFRYHFLQCDLFLYMHAV